MNADDIISASRMWVLVEGAPTHDPRGHRRRSLRVRSDASGEYVRIGKGGRMKRYLDTMARRTTDRVTGLVIYYETWPDLPNRPDLVRPEYVRAVAA